MGICGTRVVVNNSYQSFCDKCHDPNGIIAYFDYSDGGFGFIGTGSASVNDGNWHLMTFVRNGLGGKFYINGSLDSSITANRIITLLANNVMVVGADYRSSYAVFYRFNR